VADDNPQPSAAPASGLEAQLDALVADAAAHPTDAPADNPADAPAAPTDTAAAAPADVTAAASESAAPDLVGDALAQQIQQLLDDAQIQSDAAAAAAAPAAVPDDPPATDPPPPAPAPTEAQALAEIDNHLAKEADTAIAGEFETVQEVMSAAQQAQAPAPPSSEPAILPADPVPTSVAPQVPAPPVPAAAPAVSAAAAPVPVPAAARSAPAAAPTPAGATSQDVARELDEQPAAATTPAAPPTPGPTPAPVPVPAPVARKPAAARRATPWQALDRLLRRALAAVDSPLRGLTPGARNILGLVALVTVFNATCLLVYVTVIKPHTGTAVSASTLGGATAHDPTAAADPHAQPAHPVRP
jgi:hypothetical protein